jgi:hypothetical protein
MCLIALPFSVCRLFWPTVQLFCAGLFQSKVLRWTLSIKANFSAGFNPPDDTQ